MKKRKEKKEQTKKGLPLSKPLISPSVCPVSPVCLLEKNKETKKETKIMEQTKQTKRKNIRITRKKNKTETKKK